VKNRVMNHAYIEIIISLILLFFQRCPPSDSSSFSNESKSFRRAAFDLVFILYIAEYWYGTVIRLTSSRSHGKPLYRLPRPRNNIRMNVLFARNQTRRSPYICIHIFINTLQLFARRCCFPAHRLLCRPARRRYRYAQPSPRPFSREERHRDNYAYFNSISPDFNRCALDRSAFNRRSVISRRISLSLTHFSVHNTRQEWNIAPLSTLR